MMTEAEVKDMIEKLTKQRDQLAANLAATDGALTAYRSILDPTILQTQPAPPAE